VIELSDFKGDVFIHICPVHLIFFQPVGSLVHLSDISMSLVVVSVHLYLSKFFCFFGQSANMLVPVFLSFKSVGMLTKCYILLFLTIYKTNFNREHEVEEL
jgi:hypothetical protein